MAKVEDAVTQTHKKKKNIVPYLAGAIKLETSPGTTVDNDRSARYAFHLNPLKAIAVADDGDAFCTVHCQA